MRHLNPSRGLTLVELMVTVAIAALLAAAALPHLGSYIVNSRLREGGHIVLTQALLAQSEAIKRNTAIRLATGGASVQVLDLSDAEHPMLLREHTLAGEVSAAKAAIDFGGEGRPVPLGPDVEIALSTTAAACSSDTRCPALLVDAGGAIRLCKDLSTECS